MSFPKQSEIQLPLLIELQKAGGKAPAQHLYKELVKYFPELTEADRLEKMSSSPSIFKWHNWVQWARQQLVDREELRSAGRGIWEITDRGRERIKGERRGEIARPRNVTERAPPSPESSPKVSPSLETTLRDMMQAHEEAIKRQLLSRLREMHPKAFETFSKRLLEVLGFTEMEVTRYVGDGGIDGFGKFRQGIVFVDAAFQSKRWQATVSRAEIDQFRGTVVGKYDQGVFITTSSFSKEAREVSIRKGAPPIILVDGEQIVDLMIQYGLGVTRQPMYLVEINPDELDTFE